MEKMPIPQAERFVGDEKMKIADIERHFDVMPVDETGKVITDSRKILEEVFNTGSGRKIDELEIEKTPEDIEDIRTATEAVKQFASTYNKEYFLDLPLENIHLLKEGGVEEYTKGRLKTGSHATVLGTMMIDKRSRLETAITLFHELWHTIGSYKAVQVTTDKNFDWFRSGFSAKSRDAKKEWFYHLDEALTGIMTKKFFDEVIVKHPEFTEEIKKITESGEKVDTTRSREVGDMEDLINDLYENNKDQFTSKQEILNLFFEGQVTGNILPAARLVEKTYGKGSFRKLGDF